MTRICDYLGGGIYTPPRSYALVLQSLLSGSSLLLSRPSMDSLFESTLPTEQSRADLAEMVGPMSNMKWAPGDVDWSTGLCVWHRRKEDGEGKPWGRLEGSAGWAGAANTMYWVDRKAEIAVSSWSNGEDDDVSLTESCNSHSASFRRTSYHSTFHQPTRSVPSSSGLCTRPWDFELLVNTFGVVISETCVRDSSWVLVAPSTRFDASFQDRCFEHTLHEGLSKICAII